MRRSLILLVAAVAIVTAAAVVSHRVGYYVGQACCGPTSDDLLWLRQEFGLKGAELARIRKLHEGYLPQCRHWCALINAKSQALAQQLARATNAPPDLMQKLAEVDRLRAHCQMDMIRHFYRVSQAMPPAAGHRYLEEMIDETIAHHEVFEKAMQGDSSLQNPSAGR